MRNPKTQTTPFDAPQTETAITTPMVMAGTGMHGDRGDDDGSDADAAATALPVYVRFSDLVVAGITTNWPHLFRLIDDEGFPEGVLLSRNIRAWLVDDVRRWLAARPTDRKMINVEKARQTRRRKRDVAGAAASPSSA